MMWKKIMKDSSYISNEGGSITSASLAAKQTFDH